MSSLRTSVFLLLATLLSASLFGAGTPERHRMIVLTDVENEPDDTQSLVRLMLYTNEIELQGLIATTSIHLRNRVSPESIHQVVEAYGKVLPNLIKHDPHYPSEAALRKLIKSGPALYGMQAVGPGKESEGSEWIIQTLKAKDPRPLWVTVWGGANTLAQALQKLQANEKPDEFARLLAKLRVYTISDQDDSGAWMRKTFPDLFFIVSPGGYGGATWTAIHHRVDGIDNTTISNEWLAKNIQQGHGPLGALYPDVSYGMEGDTPSWLGLIPNGLNNPEIPNWGGWGGRYEKRIPVMKEMDPKGFTGGVPIEDETRPIWTNAVDTYSPATASSYGRAAVISEAVFSDFRVTLWRWRDAIQNDFAARMDWTIKPFDQANHPPVAKVAHGISLRAKSGEHVQLDASGSFDPDGDNLTYHWCAYPEATGLKDPIKFLHAQNSKRSSFVAPEVTAPTDLHIILQVSDKGSPSLSRYQRIVVTVAP